MNRKVVFDCMVFVQLIASKGPAFQCYERAVVSGHRIVMSTQTLSELANVLGREDVQRRLPGITPERAEALLRHLEGFALIVGEVPERFPFPDDPKDEPYLNLAIEARAHFLVTRDKAILRLCEPLHPLGQQLRRLNPMVRVLKPETFLIVLAAHFP